MLFLNIITIWKLGGEIQEEEVFLPIIFQKYSLDLSRIRSHFIPGFPLNMPVCQQ